MALKAAILNEGPFASGSGTGIVGLLKDLIPGFATGGYTGPGGTHDPAGMVHRGEYVFDKASTSRIGVGTLEALRRGGLPGYASGGAVGMPRLVLPAVAPRSTAPSVKVTVQTLPGTTADVNPRRNGDGALTLDVVMRQVKSELIDDLRTMGPFARAQAGRFHLKPRGV